MRWTLAVVCALTPAFSLGGCAANQEIVDPSKVTLEQALVDTVDALAEARQRSMERNTNFAFYGCTVTASFNVSATQTVGTKLALSATGGPPAAIAPISINLSGSRETSDSGTRGNVVTVVLATPGCLPNPKAFEATRAVIKTAKSGQVERLRTTPAPGAARPATPPVPRPGNVGDGTGTSSGNPPRDERIIMRPN